MTKKFACVILAAGQGTRMKSSLPKPLHPVAGLPMVNHVINTAQSLNPEKIVVVIGQNMDNMAQAVAPHPTTIQKIANGTGGAVIPAQSELQDFDGDVIVLFGDTPLITAPTIQAMLDKRRESPDTGLVYSAMDLDDPKTYGRMVLNNDGTLNKIVEFKDANDNEKSITLCNGGIVCADGRYLFQWLDQLGNDNAQGEYYLTDLPDIALKDGKVTQIVTVNPIEMEGANSRSDLAHLEQKLQQRYRTSAMDNGVTLIDPDSVFLSHDTKIGHDVTIGPNVIFGTGVTIEPHVVVEAFCHIQGAYIKSGATIGPFARLRPGTVLGENTKIGNFVETKNTTLGDGAKASHLTYLGDADIGQDVNVGAGTITCNYDGFLKHKTTIEDGAFIGSNTSLVAPITIGKGSITGAGSTITKDTEQDSLNVTRPPQKGISGWASKFRKLKKQEKEDQKKESK